MGEFFTKSVRQMALAAGLAAAFAAPAAAQAPGDEYIVNFTGSDGNGGTLSGTAVLGEQGYTTTVLAFNAIFDNLAQEGAISNTASFGLGDVADATFYAASNKAGSGQTTFTFDLADFESGITGVSCGYDCLLAFDNQAYPWNNYFTTEVTSYTVPEPASIAVLGFGLIGLTMLRRRTRQG